MNELAIDARLASIKHIALDMDGTIYKGGTLFDFTLPFLANMRELGVGITFLTNNSSHSTHDYLKRLLKLGLPVELSQVVTSGRVAIEYLQRHHPNWKRLYLLGTDSLRQEFAEAGFSLVGDDTADEPDAVVIGFDTGLTYRRLCVAAYWVSRNKPFVATHPDLVCPTDEEILLVDCGAMCAALSAATGKLPDTVLGKPHASMLEVVLQRHGLRANDLAMVGDRLSTDIAMASANGVMGVLVLTGEATAADAEKSSFRPDLVVASLAELGKRLRSVRETN